MNLKKHKSPHGRTVAVTMMKDEGPYALEWFAHHFALGFTDILAYTNDCTDGTDRMFIRLEELGLAHHRRNNIPKGVKPQPSAIQHAQQEPIVQNSDWVLLFDADEFLSIKYGSGTLDEVLTAAGDAHAIVITWRIFGSSMIHDWSREPVTEQFIHAAPAHWNKGWGVKTLFRFDADKWKLGIHRPSMKKKVLDTDYPDTIHWLNGSGKPMEDYFKFRGWRSIRRTLGYDWLQMNHYAVKSIDAYAARRLRGNVNNKSDKYNADYWALQDRNEVKETSILRHSQARAAVMSELLKDPILNRLHTNAIEMFEAKLGKIKETEDFQVLKENLIKASGTPIQAVDAKPPKARDPAKIAALMSAVEAKNADRPKDERRNAPVGSRAAQVQSAHYLPSPVTRSHNQTATWVDNHGIQLPANPQLFTDAALRDVENGKFDRRNARTIASFLRPKERLLNLGSGVGFIPMRACITLPDVVVLSHEIRGDLTYHAQQILQKNPTLDSARIKIVDGPLCFDSDNALEASGLHAYIQDFRPTALRIDGDHLDPEILKNLPLFVISRIIVANASPGIEEHWGSISNNLGFTPLPETATLGALVMDLNAPKPCDPATDTLK